MKKKFLITAIVLCIACMLIFSVACLNSGDKDEDEDLPSGSSSSGNVEEPIFRTDGHGKILGLTKYGRSLT